MIIGIDLDIFVSSDKNVLSNLTSIFRILFKSDCEHMWDASNVDTDAIESIKEEEWFTKHLSITEQELFERLIKKEEITKIKEFYFSSFFVKDAQQLESLIQILSEVSYVILENGTNDWKFVKGIVFMYSKVKNERKILYRKLKRCIETNQLRSDHAGGTGQIINRIKAKEAIFGSDYIKYRVATIFDNDKTKVTDNISFLHQKIISYIKRTDVLISSTPKFEATDLIPWHVLYKREIENYLPLYLILNYFPLDDVDEIKGFSNEEYDFIDIEDYFSPYDVKNDFPTLFLKDELKRFHLEERCEHHKNRIDTVGYKSEEITEMELLLVKLARII